MLRSLRVLRGALVIRRIPHGRAFSFRGEVQPNERPRLVETLIQLRDVGVHDRYFERYDDLGARTIVDIDYLIAFDKQIGNPPDDRLLVEIANLDLDELERGLILRDIIRIKSQD